jgi:hypothetical protein
VLSTLLGFVLLGVFAYLAYFALQWVYSTLQAGGKPADAINVLTLAALGGVGYLYRSAREQRQQFEARLASAKRERYEAYVDIIKEMVSHSQEGKPLDPAAYIPSMRP